MRWWNAAWSLAREMKLGREAPGAVDCDNPRGNDDSIADGTTPEQASARASMKESLAANLPGVPNEEEREERRRVWWLLYTVVSFSLYDPYSYLLIMFWEPKTFSSS